MKTNRKTCSKKGGFFGLFSRKAPVINEEQCNPNNLPNLQTTDELKLNYQQCCPKKMFGFKNKSPYCKQVDLNYQSALEKEKMNEEYIGVEPEDIYDMKQNASQMPVPELQLQGGKRRKSYKRKTNKSNKRKKLNKNKKSYKRK